MTALALACLNALQVPSLFRNGRLPLTTRLQCSLVKNLSPNWLSGLAKSNFHNDYMKGKVTLIGCPKLDAVDYSAKLTEILKFNDIQSITLVRMEVPCCGGLEAASKKALQDSGKSIPIKVVTLSIHGEIQ